MPIQDNIEMLNKILSELRAHPMCAKFEETETHYRITFPPGFQIDGAQANKDMGKWLAAFRLIRVMEREWIAGGIQ